MTESYNTEGPQSPAMALTRAPLKRLVVPAVVIFTLAGMAGCFGYFVVAPAPVSQSGAPLATEALPSTVGQARETGMLAVLDRPTNEDIVKAFQLATEDRQPVVAQDAVFDTDQPPIAGPIPLPKRRPPPRP